MSGYSYSGQTQTVARLMAGFAKVECPVCKAQVAEQEINNHLDSCIAQEPNRKRPRMSEPSGSSSGQRRHVDTVNIDAHVTGAAQKSSGVQFTSLPTPATVNSPITSDGKSSCMQQRPEAAPMLLEATSNASSPHALATGLQPEEQLKAAPMLLEATSNACSREAATGLQPEEHLKADLIGSRAYVLRGAKDDSLRAHAKVLQLCGEIRRDIDRRRGDFENYNTMGKPSDHAQQRARNVMREELTDVVQGVRCNLKCAMTASSEPGKSLREAAKSQRERIAAAICMLQELDAQTAEEFDKLEEQESLKRQSDVEVMEALAEPLKYLDSYVSSVTSEVEEETATAMQKHTEKLEELRKEEARFVLANDTPERNPAFAKVIQDIASTKQVLDEHAARSDSCKGLAADWADIVNEIPKPKQTQLDAAPVPQSTLWDRILGRP